MVLSPLDDCGLLVVAVVVVARVAIAVGLAGRAPTGAGALAVGGVIVGFPVVGFDDEVRVAVFAGPRGHKNFSKKKDATAG